MSGRAAGPTAEDRTAGDGGVLLDGRGPLPFSLRRRAPAPDVAARVERHWTTAWDLTGREDHVQEVLPHPCVNLVAHDGIVRVHGVPTGRDVRRLTGRGRAIGTKFRPGAFAALTAIPMVALRDEAATLEQAFGHDGRRLEARVLAAIGDAGTADDRGGFGAPADPADHPDGVADPGPLDDRGEIADPGPADDRDELADPDPDAVWDLVAAFLAPRIPDVDPLYDLVVDVARDLLHRAPDARIPDVARDHGVSERTLQRAFRRAVGVSPKWVLARYRLHEATERLAADPDEDLARLALDLGYADQPHFSGDFRGAVGVTPSAYARACRALVGAAA